MICMSAEIRVLSAEFLETPKAPVREVNAQAFRTQHSALSTEDFPC
jgi:hypothetical protein